MQRSALLLTLVMAVSGTAFAPSIGSAGPQTETDFAWGQVVTLDDASRGARDIAVNARGDAIVVWSRHAGHAASIYARYRPAGGTWRPLARLGFGTEPQVALDASGNATAIWSTHPDGWGDAVHASRRPRRTGTWTDPVVLSIPAREPGYAGRDHRHDSTFPLLDHVGAGRAMLTINARGDAAVAWHFRKDVDERSDGDDLEFVVQAVYRPAGGRWSHVMAVSEPQPPERVKSAPHAIGIDRRGAVTVMWLRYDDRDQPTDGSVRVRRMTAQREWGREVVVNRGAFDGTDWFENRDWYIDLAVSPAGPAIAVVSGKFSLRRPGGNWTPSRTIRTRKAAVTADAPFLIMDRDGTAYAASYPTGLLIKSVGRRWRWRSVPSAEFNWLMLEGNARGDVLLHGRGEDDEAVAAYRSRTGDVVEGVALADHTFGLPASAVLPHGGAIVVWATWDRHIQLRELLPTG